ncbi:MAG: radical SAM protein [Desulfopila sp.]
MPITPKTVGFRPGERNIFLHILTACNLSCSHCYINPDQHGTQTLDIGTVKKWLQLFARDERGGNVIFLGGEPTLHPELPAAIRFAKKLGFTVTVDSNGFLFHDLLHKTTPAELDCLSFSLDGPDAATNDAIRGEGVFEVCVDHLRQAVQLGFEVSVIYTVSRRNIAKLQQMKELLNDLGVRKLFIQVIGLRGKSAPENAGRQPVQVSRTEWLAVVPEVARQIAEAGVQVTYPKVFLAADEEFACGGNVAENFFVFPNGRVYQCPLGEDHPINSYRIENGLLEKTSGLTEDRLFQLTIAEGCVMNKLLQPDTIEYHHDGRPAYRISCCLLKSEIG